MKLTMADIRRKNKEAGMHWFDRDTLAFFGCRVLSKRPLQGPGGVFFIAQENDTFSGEQKVYRVYRAHEDGSIRRESGALGTRYEAESVAKTRTRVADSRWDHQGKDVQVRREWDRKGKLTFILLWVDGRKIHLEHQSGFVLNKDLGDGEAMAVGAAELGECSPLMDWLEEHNLLSGETK